MDAMVHALKNAGITISEVLAPEIPRDSKKEKAKVDELHPENPIHHSIKKKLVHSKNDKVRLENNLCTVLSARSSLK